MKNTIAFASRLVEEKFLNYPIAICNRLLFVRQLIFNVAQNTEGVGRLEETLKWGEPSYITAETKSGSTIRLGSNRSSVDHYAIYFNCKTTLIGTFKEVYADLFKYEGNRGLVFHKNDKIAIPELSSCIGMALTYHLSKKKRN
jgi:hypothetical protein